MNAAVAAKTGMSKKARKKAAQKKLKIYGAIGGTVLVSILTLWAIQPIQGTIQYGICKVFVEQSVRYPTEMKIVSVAERPTDVRMEYTVINEFGDFAAHMAICLFQKDQKGNPMLKRAVLDRQKIDQAKIDIFNLTIPLILSNPPDLTVPPPIKDELLDLRR